jgi:protein-glutamine gamma-glutamyltransferase
VVQGGMSRFLGLEPKDDATIAYRVVSAATVVVSVLAAVLQEAVTAGTGIAALGLVPLGSYFSYVRRNERNILLKVLLALGLAVAFIAFLQSVRGATTIDDTRTPLVAMFLWVQVLHSFDVPRARDLTFSVAASVALIALAGSLAFTTGFIIVFLVYAVLLVASLALGHQAQLRSVDGELAAEVKPSAARTPGRSPRALVRGAAALGAATLFATSVAFVFLPRLPGAQIAALPFSLTRGSPIPGFTGNVMLPNAPGQAVGSSTAFDPDTYFGYGESMSLRVRGRLSNELVMRVRSPEPSLYRGQVYDRYDDGTWTSSDTDLSELRGDGIDPISVPTSRYDRGRSVDELVQTFYIERELPNIVFHAYRAHEVYIAETTLTRDRASSLRVPYTLETDTIYSVVSRLPPRSPEILRASGPADTSDPELSRYLQVPKSLDGRFRRLATRITSDEPTTVGKVDAVEAWLHENKRYRLDIPRDPPGRDPVDVFVFDRDEGFCEQIAATMALMLRASDVPARVVTGFGPGERNAFTGYWEVKNSDAHAWVEVYYADVGWIPYDPTFGVPFSDAANTTFMLAPLKRLAESLLPDGLLAAMSRAVRDVPAVARVLIVVPVVLGIVAAFLLVRSRRRRTASGGPRAPAVDAWLEIEDVLRSRGFRREPHETAQEFARRIGNLVSDVELREVAEQFGAARYAPDDAAEVERWVREARATAQAIRRGPRQRARA